MDKRSLDLRRQIAGAKKKEEEMFEIGARMGIDSMILSDKAVAALAKHFSALRGLTVPQMRLTLRAASRNIMKDYSKYSERKIELTKRLASLKARKALKLRAKKK